jgi:hypothetical protein
MATVEDRSPYKPFDRAEPLERGFIGTIFDSDEEHPFLVPIPDPPELRDCVVAVLDLAGRGKHLIQPLGYLCSLIPGNIGKALSPTFLVDAFPAMVLEPIANSPLFELIHDILETSTNPFLLLESAKLIVSCAYASKACLRSMVNLEFLDLLFSCIPHVFLLSFPDVIFEILTGLTIIWKRLSSIGHPTTLSTEQLTNLSVITRPLSDEFRIPYMRLVCCLLVYGSLDSLQRHRLTVGIHMVFFNSFHSNPDSLQAQSPEDLGHLAEIALSMSRSECLHECLVISPRHPFINISQVIHLLPPHVAARFLFFYDECDRFCDDQMMGELLVSLEIQTLVDFLGLGILRLTEASLDVISLMIERNCIEAEIIAECIIPSIVDPLLESMVSEQFRLKRSALRFLHAVVVRLDWSVFPDETFEHFLTTTTDYISRENKTESLWFVESLLAALRTEIDGFLHFVTGLCDELDIPSTLEELREMEDPVFDQLFAQIDFILRGSEREATDSFLA